MDIKRAPPKKTKQYLLTGTGLLMLAAVTAGIASLEPALPTVDRSMIWVDSVRRGDMVRSIGAGGSLVPEHVRIISALTQGRVETILLRPGAVVEPGTVLVELLNPDLTVQILDYDQRLAAALQAHANLKNSLSSSLLSQEVQLASFEAQHRDALRHAALADSAVRPGFLMSANDAAAARERVVDAERRLTIERRRMDDMKAQQGEQVMLSEQTVQRTRAILEEQRRRALSLRVTAGESGVLKSVNVELGQYVGPGTELARIVRPELLKAVLRVAESQARDVAIGQVATIDLHNKTIVSGRVSRIDPSAQNGSVNIDVAIDGDIPPGARADQSVDGTIEIERLPGVLHVGRPVASQADGMASIFVVTPDGRYAVRKQVRFGKTSVSTIEVVAGLSAGERVIVTDMSQYEAADRVKIKN